MKKLFLFLIIVILSVVTMYGQNPPCFTDYQGLVYGIPLNQNCPPFNTDMPIDVLIGYIALDSISKNVEIEDFYRFMSRQTYNDTIKTMMRYFYKMMEYDPNKYHNYMYHPQPSKYRILDYDHPFFEYVKRKSPYSFLDASLLASYVIAKVTVNSVVNYNDTIARHAKTARIVTAHVDSIFKGKPMVNCDGQYIIEPTGYNCIKFECAKEWFENTIPEFEMIHGQSYFIFFDYRLICQTDSLSYFTIFPLGSIESKTWSIYPIVNGNLIDIYNELGFGTNVNINTFYNGLTNRINQIKNFTP
jgi:hypothetical protein